MKSNTKTIHYIPKKKNNVCCAFCGVSSFEHMHQEGTSPKEFEMKCDECLAWYRGPHTCDGLMKELVEYKKKQDTKEQKNCEKCNGTGSYMYDENHGKICEVCCKHDQGWWELQRNYGTDNGKMCCKAGCGFTRTKTQEDLKEEQKNS